MDISTTLMALEISFLQLSEWQEGFTCWLQLAVTLDVAFYDLLKDRKVLEIKSVVPYITSYLNLVEIGRISALLWF